MEQRDDIRRLLIAQASISCRSRRMHFISARHGTGVGELVAVDDPRLRSGDARDDDAGADQGAWRRRMVQHQPPIVRGRRIRLRYAHQGGRNPPRIIMHGNQAAHVPESYKRYLANMFREAVRSVRDARGGGISQRHQSISEGQAQGKARLEDVEQGTSRPAHHQESRQESEERHHHCAREARQSPEQAGRQAAGQATRQAITSLSGSAVPAF